MLAMQNPSQTIAKLRAHAAGSGPEAKIAREVLEGMGVSADAPAEDIVYLECQSDNSWHQTQLFAACCDYLGVTALQRKNRKAIKIAHGPRSMCDAVAALFGRMKTQLAELHRGTTIGFILGALPSENHNKEGQQAKPLDADGLEAARLGIAIGQRNNPRRQLGGKNG